MEQPVDLKKAFKISIVIALAIVATLIIYAIFVETIKSTHKPFVGFVNLNNIEMTRYVFYGLGIIQIIIIRVLRGFLLRKSPSDDESILIGKLFKTSILTSALCEAPAISGLIFFLLIGFYKDFYIFLFVSLFLMFMFFPRYGNWAEWLKENKTSNCSSNCL